MQINVRWNGKRQFIGECPSGHELLLDSSPEVGGENAGPRPTEALLTALGGCTGIDVIMILEKDAAEGYCLPHGDHRRKKRHRT